MVDRDSVVTTLREHFRAIREIEQAPESGIVYQPASIDLLGALYLISTLENEIAFLEAAMGSLPQNRRLPCG